jgi:RecB family exonuclease
VTAIREEELIALIPIIAEELTGAQLRDDLRQLDAIREELLGADKMSAHDALGDLEDLLADISNVPQHSNLTPEEWAARRTDFFRAAELYLKERWKPSAAKEH